MKDFFLLLKHSKLISIVWGACVGTLIDILFWIIGWDTFSIIYLATSPIFGGFIGYVAWKYHQIKEVDKKETWNKI